jgi:hypothetical protein
MLSDPGRGLEATKMRRGTRSTRFRRH